jgi:hypothetical protein
MNAVPRVSTFHSASGRREAGESRPDAEAPKNQQFCGLLRLLALLSVSVAVVVTGVLVLVGGFSTMAVSVVWDYSPRDHPRGEVR